MNVRACLLRSLMVITLLLLPNGALLAHPQTISDRPPDAQSTSGPMPPAGISPASAALAPQSPVVIAGVPAYDWHHGCGPTAAGMVIGYWDSQGFDLLVSGDASTQTSAVDSMIASEGTASNYSDYCLPMDSGEPNPLPDKSEDPPGDEHPDNCVADYMKTSQSAYSNYYGWSWFSDVGIALEAYVNSLGAAYNVTTTNYYTGIFSDFDWDFYRSEIDAGRPMVFLVDSDGNGGTDHFITAIGYDVVDNVKMYASLDTWYSTIRWEEFATIANGQPWGIWGAVSFEITGETQPTVEAAFTGTPTMGKVPITTTFTNTSNGTYTSSLWDFGDGITSTLTHPTHTYTIPRAYTVTLTVDGPDGSDTIVRPAFVTALSEAFNVYLPLALRN